MAILAHGAECGGRLRTYGATFSYLAGEPVDADDVVAAEEEASVEVGE